MSISLKKTQLNDRRHRIKIWWELTQEERKLEALLMSRLAAEYYAYKEVKSSIAREIEKHGWISGHVS